VPEARALPRALTKSREDGVKTLRLSPHPSRTGFTLIDLLVSLTVIAVLIALMLPSISSVRELTRRVVCASNTRQHGLGLLMYSDDYSGARPPSLFEAKPGSVPAPHLMMIARTDRPSMWDGLGYLYVQGYLNAPQVFYCPSHTGDSPYSAFASEWPSDTGTLVTNYQYRGARVADSTGVVIVDGLRTRLDFNYRVGANLLRADHSVQWFADVSGAFANSLPQNVGEADAAMKVEWAWEILDRISAGGSNDVQSGAATQSP